MILYYRQLLAMSRLVQSGTSSALYFPRYWETQLSSPAYRVMSVDVHAKRHLGRPNSFYVVVYATGGLTPRNIVGDIVRTLRSSYKLMRLAFRQLQQGVDWYHPQLRTLSTV